MPKRPTVPPDLPPAALARRFRADRNPVARGYWMIVRSLVRSEPTATLAVAWSGVDPTDEPRGLRDPVRGAIAERRGYVEWDVDRSGLTTSRARGISRLASTPRVERPQFSGVVRRAGEAAS